MIIDFIAGNILGGIVGAGMWFLFFGAIALAVYLTPKLLLKKIELFCLKVHHHLQKTFKIPYPILMIIYYLFFIWLFVQFIGVLIYTAEYLGFN